MATNSQGNMGQNAHAEDWSTEERWWQDNYRSRPYAKQDHSFDRYRGAYRYGFESGHRNQNRSWNDSEQDLRKGWDSYPHRGNEKSTWDEVKDAVKDAWSRVTGDHHRDTANMRR